MKYKLTDLGGVILNDLTFIPADLENADWQQYQQWLAEGNTPQPADPTPQSTPQEQIDQIERDTLMNRAMREFMLALAEKEAAAQGITPDQLYQINLGYRKVKDVDNQIIALRAQIQP